MKYLKKMSVGGRVLVALVVAGSAFGIATAVQAAIPSANGVIHGCYGKPGTPQKGELRVINAEQGEGCRFYENPLNWNQIGPTGVTGPTGPTGPTGATGGINAIERQGYVGTSGNLILSNGFTVTHTAGTGNYTLNFPAGTWNFDTTNFPAITAIPQPGGTHIQLVNDGLNGDGSAFWTLNTGAGEESFSFMILQHVGPQSPGTAPANQSISTFPK